MADPRMPLPKRNISVVVDDELLEALNAYVLSTGMNASEAIRVILRMGLTASPTKVLDEAARMQAWRETKEWTMERVRGSLEEIERHLRLTLKEHRGDEALRRLDNGT